MKRLVIFTLATVFTFSLTSNGFALNIKLDPKIKGEVISIEEEEGTIQVRDIEGREHFIKVEPRLLQGVRAGDNIEVEVENGKTKSINKKTRIRITLGDPPDPTDILNRR